MGDQVPGFGLPSGVGAHDLFRAFAEFLEERQQVHGEDKNTTKALQVVVDKVGRFDGRNITKFLRVYTCEMEVHQVSEVKMISTFDLAVDKLLFYLADKTSESGFTNDWKLVKETVGLLARQQKIKTRGLLSRLEPMPASQNLMPPQNEIKTVKDGTLEDLIKGIQDLKVEMTELKKSQMASSSKTIEGSKGFIERCMWCDNPNHKRGECDSYKAPIKDGIVYFKEGRIRLTGSDEPLKTNFRKGGMKKLVEEQTSKNSAIKGEGAESYSITVEQKGVKAVSLPTKGVMMRGAEAIRKKIGWNDPVDAISIKAYLCGDKHDDDMHDAMVEEKRGRTIHEEDVIELENKRRSPRNKEASKEQKTEKVSSSTHLGSAPLPKEWWKKGKEKEKEDTSKLKDMKSILEEKILDAKIEFTLREALGIAKKDFHELIINVIKRKRQMTPKAIMVEALDTRVTVDEEEEIGQVFAQFAMPETRNKVDMENKVSFKHVEGKREHQVECTPLGFTGIRKDAQEASVNTCSKCENEGIESSSYSVPYWARATIETYVRLGDFKDPILALVDHGSEINIMSRKIYEKNKWPIDINHGWVIRAANNQQGDLHGACLAVKTRIEDVEVEQNFFVQNSATYPVILGQPYITAARMETRVLNDGSHYARIRSWDGRKAVQFITVKPIHERHREQLRGMPLEPRNNFVDF
uniref:Predicted protein n=1 Tax=Physcomitrium patens TaxID=3218 RepID=A9U6L4_PHYPA